MKTTIDIADSILSRSKKLAKRRHVTLKELVEFALRQVLENDEAKGAPPELVTLTFKGKGLCDGLAWDDFTAIRDASYEGRGA